MGRLLLLLLPMACGCCRYLAWSAPGRIPSWMPTLGLLEAGSFEERDGLSPTWGQLPCQFPAWPGAAGAALEGWLVVVLVVTAAPASVLPL